MKCVINNLNNKEKYNPLTIITIAPDYYGILDYSQIKIIEDNLHNNIYRIINNFRLKKYHSSIKGINSTVTYKTKTKYILDVVTHLYMEYSKLKLKRYIDDFCIIIGKVPKDIKKKYDNKVKEVKENEKYYNSREFRKKIKKTLKKLTHK